MHNVLAAKVRPRALKWEKLHQTLDEEFPVADDIHTAGMFVDSLGNIGLAGLVGLMLKYRHKCCWTYFMLINLVNLTL